ncbi:hypothetical protein B9Z19DRAFT_1062263 [Tuber borchii]|uniref:Uncharacterized protein n=1 Tax=Tuber borchii TaxID=42251 RepID=A0A2T7A2F1_TUBBO|nr:hypothetical protein B9Z19DRAFT_1062263 [Tuber borchii]
MSSNSDSTTWNEPNLSILGTPSLFCTWLFNAETSDDDDANISFPNRPLTTSTISTILASEYEYLVDTDSEPCNSTPSPYSITNLGSSTPSNTTSYETPISDLGPKSSNIPTLCTEVTIALSDKICGLRHFAHWYYQKISTATRVALSMVYRITHSLVTPSYKNMRG